MTFEPDVERKIESLKGLFLSRNKRALLLTQQNNIAWLLRGRTFVSIASTKSLVDVVINVDGMQVISNNIEEKRLTEEEMPSGVSFTTYDWFETGGREQVIEKLTAGSFVTDLECEKELRDLRTVMSPAEQETYQLLGQDGADAMQKTCLAMRQGMSENQIAGILTGNCVERGVEPVVVLVAADERPFLYRHPMPTAARLKNYVMLSLCGRRFGQVVSLTRFVSIGKPVDNVIVKRNALHNISAMLFEESRPGIVGADIFEKLIAAYAAEGFPDEWKLHHQGGLIGYDSREVKIGPGSDLRVKTGNVFAWNPSITGHKSEDTFLVGEYKNIGLTNTPELPYREFSFNGKSFKMPDILELPAG